MIFLYEEKKGEKLYKKNLFKCSGVFFNIISLPIKGLKQFIQCCSKKKFSLLFFNVTFGTLFEIKQNKAFMHS